MTYVDNSVMLAMSQQHTWEAESVNACYPRHSLAVVKLFPSTPVYAMSTVYVRATQERLHFLMAMSGLHKL